MAKGLSARRKTGHGNKITEDDPRWDWKTMGNKTAAYGTVRAHFDSLKKKNPKQYRAVLANSRRTRPKNIYGFVQDSTGRWFKNEHIYKTWRSQGWKGF